MDLSRVPIYDHHAHSLFHEDVWRREPLEPLFTEASDPELLARFGRDNLFFRRSIHDLAAFYECPSRVESVVDARLRWDYRELCQRMFAAAGITRWLIDDGLWSDRLWSVEQCAASLQPSVGRIVRLETELAAIIERHETSAGLLAVFETSLREVRPRVAAFKKHRGVPLGSRYRPP